MMMKALIGIAILATGAGLFLFLRPDEKPERTTPIRIVAFGDSLTAGYGVAEEDSYPSQLGRALANHKVEIVNLGVSGDTTQDARNRLQQVLDENPDIVILGIGGNDALRVLPVSEAKANIEHMIRTLKNAVNPPRIILLEMQAGINGGLSYKREFDQIYEDLADQYGLQLVPFIITKIYLDSTYVLPDRIHMNREGYAYVIREHLADAVLKEIKKPK